MTSQLALMLGLLQELSCGALTMHYDASHGHRCQRATGGDRRQSALVAYGGYRQGRAAAFVQPFREYGLVRLAIGLEAASDLIADLDASLTTAYGPAGTAS